MLFAETETMGWPAIATAIMGAILGGGLGNWLLSFWRERRESTKAARTDALAEWKEIAAKQDAKIAALEKEMRDDRAKCAEEERKHRAEFEEELRKLRHEHRNELAKVSAKLIVSELAYAKLWGDMRLMQATVQRLQSLSGDQGERIVADSGILTKMQEPLPPNLEQSIEAIPERTSDLTTEKVVKKLKEEGLPSE